MISVKISKINTVFIIFFYILVSLFFGTKSARAASFILVPDMSLATSTGKISIDVMLDNEDQSINAISGTLIYPTDLVKIDKISIDGSIVNSWIEAPNQSSGLFIGGGKLMWSGIIPGGFSGVLSPFYDGARPGKVFQAVFVLKKSGSAGLSLRDLDVRLNDGKGTKVSASSTPINLVINEADILEHPSFSPLLWVILMLSMVSTLIMGYIIKKYGRSKYK